MNIPPGASPSYPAFLKMERIVKAADGRPLTVAQKVDYDLAAEEWLGHARQKTSGTLHQMQELNDHLGAFLKAGSDPQASFAAAKSLMSMSPGRQVMPENEPGVGDDWSDGAVKVLKNTDRMADIMRGSSGGMDPNGASADVSLPRFLKGIVTGDWTGVAPAVKSMAVGESGGYLVPSPVAARVIDKARNAATVVKAGAITVPMTSSTLTVARLAGDPTATWHLENQAVTATDATLEAVVLRSRTVVALTKLSVELFEDGEDVAGVIESSLGAALGLELDRAALLGSGVAGEPLGLLNQPGVTVTGSIGSPASYVAFADTPVMTLQAANAQPPYSLITSPRTYNSLGKLVTGISGDLTRLAPPPAWNELQRFVTNQVPENLGAGTNEGVAFYGDFSQLMIGMRTSLTIEASREASDSSTSAFGNLQVWVRAYLRCDIALAHPSHFVVLTGVLA